MNSMYSAALADEYRSRLVAEASLARLARQAQDARRSARSRGVLHLPSPARVRAALRRPVIIGGRPRPA
ncbi:MAG TPA: hypothetical protein VJ831_16405 [Jatrophihabitantaceae bacterium]|nr:hypothetical protein [Jatrophihabitantaceae bacterium]